MSEGRLLVGDDAIELMLDIRMDGFVTGYASAILLFAGKNPEAELFADTLADSAADQIEGDPLVMEAQRQQIRERLAGIDSGPMTITPVGDRHE